MSAPIDVRPNENIYQRLGVRTIVNASGPSTRLSGGIMRPEVARAMSEASQWCVDLAHLQGRASEILAEATGAEAGYVTAGASASLMPRRRGLHCRARPREDEPPAGYHGDSSRGRDGSQSAQHVRPRGPTSWGQAY